MAKAGQFRLVSRFPAKVKDILGLVLTRESESSETIVGMQGILCALSTS